MIPLVRVTANAVKQFVSFIHLSRPIVKRTNLCIPETSGKERKLGSVVIDTTLSDINRHLTLATAALI